MKNFLLILVFTIISIAAASAQSFTLSGIVTDSLQNPLVGANILATSIEMNQTVFSVTDESGRFRMKLKRNVSYKLEISFVGFIPVEEEVTLSSDRDTNFMLSEKRESLGEVVIRSEMAVIVKQDTIIYNVDKFKTDADRKLKDILGNLPGVDIDHKGRVTVNGKLITKLMIDGKDFFGGDTKLGVDNIPADVIESIEVLDNYSEVAFMKGLADSDMMALNIKLKKGKKNFLFGESRAGAGIKDRYEIAPALFYYSPKTTINLLGNFNNTGDAPLDYNAITRFKGGRSNWDDPIKSDDSGLYRFSEQPDARFQQTNFSGINFNQELSNNLFVEAYSIMAYQKTENLIQSDILYLADEHFIENREEAKISKDISNFNKIKFRYKPDAKKDLAYNALINFSNNQYNQELRTKTEDSTNFIFANRNPNHFIVEQHLRYNTQPSYEKTYEVMAKYIYEQNTYRDQWKFDKPVFSDIIPFEENGDSYNINQDYRSFINQGQVQLKHYRVLSPFHHVYPKVGTHFFHQIYKTTNFQELDDGSYHYFSAEDFDNNLHFSLVDPYIGLEYKMKINKLEMTTGLTYHQYLWRINQFGSISENRRKGILIPEFLTRYDISGSTKLELRYKLLSSFENAPYFANRFRLINFNQLFRGNKDLENSVAHEALLNYFLFDNRKKINAFFELSFLQRAKSIKATTLLEGVDQVVTAVYSALPERNYGVNGQVGKTVGNLKYSFFGRADISKYVKSINSENIHYQNQFYNYSIEAETLFKKWPNLSVGIRQNFNISKSENFESNFSLVEPHVDLSYSFWSSFIIKADYSYSIFTDRTENRRDQFDEANFSVFYRHEKSRFGFEIKAYNLLNTDFRRTTSYLNQFMVFDQQTFIQPRRVLFSVFYRI